MEHCAGELVLQNFSEHFPVEPVLAGEVAFLARRVAEPFIDAEDVADVGLRR